MPGIIAGALVAHPPILFPAVGGASSERLRSTIEAFGDLDQQLASYSADTLLMISPHSRADARALLVRHGPLLRGDLRRFRAQQVGIEAEVDSDLACRLVDEARSDRLPLDWSDDLDLDHGIVVPLFLLSQTLARKRCVFLAISGWPLRRFVEFGAWLHGRLSDRAALLIASGDLSHRLTADAPYGFRPEGPQFDRLVIDALTDQEWTRIDGLDPDFIEDAGECGLRPLAILLGAARAASLSSKVLSYEGPFGVGYPVVAFTPRLPPFNLQDLGRRAIEAYLRTRELIEPPEPIPLELQKPAAVFVTLEKEGRLRGCVGSMLPNEPTAAHEFIRYAVAAALRDPRFQPVRLDEVPSLHIKAQVLGPPEAVTDLAEIDPAVHGIIVRCGDRNALLLPGIDSMRSPEEQVKAACDKAGILPFAPIKVERFRVRTIE